mmetsp:Transcript_36403/g.59319  ORF Transcript_36403/g.59319 Transcript_36403/m.59319 type:complete len:415 (+) Transcript_36403:31-1275(+)
MPAEKAGMELCRCEGAKLSYGVHELVPSFTLHLHTGHRYALLGRNGVGKTTLFNAIADGTLPGFPPFLKLSYLKQEQSLQFKEKTVLDYCVACVMEARQEELRAEQEHLEARLEALEDCDGEGLEELEAVSERLGEIDELLEGFQSDRLADLAEKVLKGLGFKMTRRAALASSLSGGWRMRLELAAALVEKPQLLLLDEPTNHLDLGALLRLENFLQSNEAPGTVIVVSHDRAFVNNVCTDLLILENQQLKLHPGITFDEYESTRAEKEAHYAQTQDARVRQETKARAAVDNMRKSYSGAKDDGKLKQAKEMENKIVKLALYKEGGGKYTTGAGFDRSVLTAQSLEKTEKFCFAEPSALRQHPVPRMWCLPSLRPVVGMRTIVCCTTSICRFPAAAGWPLSGTTGRARAPCSSP